MSRTTPSVDAVLTALNPVPTETVTRGLDERANHDLALIVADHPCDATLGRAAAHSRRGGTLRFRLSAAAVVILAVIASIVPMLRPDRSAAYAATPRPLTYRPWATAINPTALLHQIANHANALPDNTGRGRYARVALDSWDLFTRVNGRQIRSAVVPQETVTWLADDGSGRRVTTFKLPGQTVRTDHVARAGELGLMWPLRSLSSIDVVLNGQLTDAHPEANGPAERLVAVEDAYRQMPLPPTVRAAMLRYLAATPGLIATGQVVDRAGRRGIAFSLTSDYSGLPTRYTVIIDPEDGRLLGSEAMLTTNAGKLNVRVPSIIAYTVYRSAWYSDSTA